MYRCVGSNAGQLLLWSESGLLRVQYTCLCAANLIPASICRKCVQLCAWLTPAMPTSTRMRVYPAVVKCVPVNEKIPLRVHRAGQDLPQQAAPPRPAPRHRLRAAARCSAPRERGAPQLSSIPAPRDFVRKQRAVGRPRDHNRPWSASSSAYYISTLPLSASTANLSYPRPWMPCRFCLGTCCCSAVQSGVDRRSQDFGLKLN
jgi:hypothetical protein